MDRNYLSLLVQSMKNINILVISLKKYNETKTEDAKFTIIKNLKLISEICDKSINYEVAQIWSTCINEIGRVNSCKKHLSIKEEFDVDNLDQRCFIFRYLFKILDEIENPIDNSNGILDNHEFILNFKMLINPFILNMGKITMNMYEVSQYISAIINKITRPNYCIVNCDNNGYTCGRAILENYEPNKNTRIIIFDTVSEHDDNMNTNRYFEKIINNIHGGRKNFYGKYKKYYNELRKAFSSLVEFLPINIFLSGILPNKSIRIL
jgi:hypothetical protein